MLDKKNAVKSLPGFFFVCLAFLVQCGKPEEICEFALGDSILVPLGRSFLDQSEIEIRINGKLLQFSTMDDGYGGFWAKIPCTEFSGTSTVTVRYIRRAGQSALFHREDDSIAAWTKSSRFIDSDDPAIQAKAREIHDDALTVGENIRSICSFVTGHVKFDMAFHRAPASLAASQTLQQRVGVCINFSRLLIALCRASGIAARSISGIVLSREQFDQYDFHHEWVEYMDENGMWHPLDLTYSRVFDLSDVRYTDLVYAAEDHPWFAAFDNNSLSTGQPVVLENSDIVLFHYHPIFPGAKYGFALLEDCRPDHLIIEKTIRVTKNGNRIMIEQ